jgi:hypothetical protein
VKRQGRGGAARTARFNLARCLADIAGAGAAAALISACSGSATKWAPWPLIQKARAFANLVSLSEWTAARATSSSTWASKVVFTTTDSSSADS